MKLLKRQYKIALEMWKGATKQEILDKYNLTEQYFDRITATDEFKNIFAPLVDRSKLQAKIILARSLPNVAERLIQLMFSDKEETARKVCMDILEDAGVLYAKDEPAQSKETSLEDIIEMHKRARNEAAGNAQAPQNTDGDTPLSNSKTSADMPGARVEAGSY